MESLDTEHELPAPREEYDLPPPHHRPGWSWLLALVISTTATFVLTLVLVATQVGTTFVVASVPVVFIFTLFLSHAVADRAR